MNHGALFKRISVILFLCLMYAGTSEAQKRKTFFDGPYIKTVDDSYHLQWVAKGKVKDSIVKKANATKFINKGLPEVDLANLNFKQDTYTRHDSISKFLAISDIHGQHDLFIDSRLQRCAR